MINNKVIENELKDIEKQIEDLLLRIKQLRKEVQDMIPPEVKKVMLEMVLLDKNDFDDYIDLNKYFHLTDEHIKIKNYIRYTSKNIGKFTFYNTTHVLLSKNTLKKEIRLTYIPSKKLVIIVER